MATLQELGVVPSYSRPAVSNDNPCSEALFKTLKYRPEYPAQPFSSRNDARDWVSQFVDWYNHHHRHSAIQFVMPAQRLDGLDHPLLKQRRVVYEGAKRKHPERRSRHIRNWDRVDLVYLNSEKAKSVAGSFPFKEAA